MLTVLRYIKRKYWTSELRATTGRSLVRHLLSVLNRPEVLMPRYVPEGILGPCYDAGVSINYYDLNSDLTPDVASILRNISTGTMVIVIHYFGYPSPTDQIRELVNEYKGILFEDCAQALYDDVSKAHDADVALWSLNKFMPVNNGAILRSRTVNVGIDHEVMVGDPRRYRMYQKHLEINTKIAEMIAEPGLELACLQAQSVALYEEYYKEINHDYCIYSQTKDSKLIESQFDYEKEQAVRKVNAWQMSMVLPNLRTGCLPQFAYPLLCESAKHRDTVAEKLLKLGIIAARQVDKWNRVVVAGTPEHFFMENHLLLPLGDVMDKELIGQISSAL